MIMKQWIKCSAVVCSFLIMSGVFFPDSGNSVKASETASVSDGDVGTESWTVSIKYDVDGTVTEGTGFTESGNFFGFTTASAPVKDGYEFQGWLCSVSGENINDSAGMNGSIFKPDTSSDNSYNYNDYNGATITFTAKWKDIYQDTVKIIYDKGNNEVIEETIKQELEGDVYESSFNITVTSELPSKNGYTFEGWLNTVDNKIYEAGSSAGSYDWAVYSSGDSSNLKTITFTAQWSENAGTTTTPDNAAGTIFSIDGTFPVKAGLEYRLDTGTWTVDNGSDGCQYVGGNSFYVKESRDYTFEKN